MREHVYMKDQSKAHWQIKTVPITNAGDDKLSHDSIAELLDEKINYLFKEDNVPSCICLNGEYGSGKSTIINLLFDKWKLATNKKVVHFNIWRHKEENTYYALFRNIFYALKNKNKNDFRQSDFLESITENDEILDLDSEFSELVYASFSKKRTDQVELNKGVSEFVKELPKYTLLLTKGLFKTVFLGSALAAIIAGLIDFAIEMDAIESTLFALKMFLIFITSTGIFSILSKNIFKNLPTLFKFHVQPAEHSISLPSITNTEQLQCVFRNILSSHNRNNGNDKLLIVIEDVDRKHNDEIIETLNELRTFIDLGKAIFIIPCDLNNIERAFYDSAIDKSNDIDEQYIRWKAKDFCSKIFSHTISLPPQGQQDLRQFLVNKITSESPNNPLKLLLKQNGDFEQLIDVLLANAIKTPREAINIYNRFTLQIEHALKLEKNSSRLKKGTISNNILPYARVYMLSTFYGLEQHLLKYPELPSWIIDNFRSRPEHYYLRGVDETNSEIKLSEEIPKYAQRYFRDLIKTGVISLDVEEFVSRTEAYDSQLTKAFIHLDEVSYSGELGSAIYGDVVRSLKSRNIQMVTELLENDPKEISIVISKVLANINYSSDFQSYVPSLIDIILNVDPSKRKNIADFALEHFDRVTNSILYAFPANNIETIFSLGSSIQSRNAKKTYFSILHKDRASVTEYCTEEKVFEIVLMLIGAINKDNKYVDSDIKSLLIDISSVPASDTNEFEQRRQLLEVIRGMDEKTIIELFSTETLNRFITDLDDFYNESEDFSFIKEDINRLISIFIKIEKANTLDIINLISGHKINELDNWFIQLAGLYEEYLYEKVELNKIHQSIKSNIIANYLTEDNYSKNSELINDAIALFAKLDGYGFTKFESKNTESFHELTKLYKELITSDVESDFLTFIYSLIDKHEEVSKYTFTHTLIDSIQGLLETNLDNKYESPEFSRCKVTAEFLSRNGRVSRIKDEKQAVMKDFLFPKLQRHLSQNKANTDVSKALFSFIETLNYDPKFGDILAGWINDTQYPLAANVPFSHFRDYLSVLNLVINKISKDYLESILRQCYSMVTSYPSNESHTLDVWDWINKIAQVNQELPLFENSIIPFLISNYDNKESYFSGKTTEYVISFLSLYSPFKDATEQKTFNNFLLWAMDEEPKYSRYLESNFEYFDMNQKLECTLKVHSLNKWEDIVSSLINNSTNTQEFIKSLIVDENNYELVKTIYSKTSDKIDWNKISVEAVKDISESLNFSAGEFINTLDNEIIAQFDVSDILETFDNYLIELLKDNLPRKFLALDLIDKFDVILVPKSKLVYAIKQEFVDTCDINNSVEELSKIRRWLKKHDLTKYTGILAKLKSIKSISEPDFARKLDSIIKY